jgi:bifunctional non-homologous end joining protein LigD
MRALRSDDFVIVGFTAPARSRTGFGALHLGAFAGSELVWCGRVGSGFGDRDLAGLRRELDALVRPSPPCDVPAGERRGARFVEPRLVCEVRYAEITGDGLLRQPVFVRLRPDKAPEECLHPARSADPDPPAGREAGPGAPGVAFTNLDKVFWPGEGITKGDLIEYHRAIGPWLLPYLRDRPLVLTRYPDGIAGKSFFQKDAPAWAPEWVRTERMWSEHGGREISYFVCDELEQLLWVVNLGTIPLHVWSSRVATLARPDWCILDLDPKGAPFAHVVEIARALHGLCEEIGLPSFVKTSGSTGLHVLVPLGRQLTYEQSRALAEVLASHVVQQLPEVATLARAIPARRGRVYVDTGQNGHGRLLVAPFCVRPLPGAPVSMPLDWSEVDARLDPARFHLRSAVARMQRLGEDPLRPVLDASPDLLAALERLGGRAAAPGRAARPRSSRRPRRAR